MGILARNCVVCSRCYVLKGWTHRSVCGPRCEVVYKERQESLEAKEREQRQKVFKDKEAKRLEKRNWQRVWARKRKRPRKAPLAAENQKLRDSNESLRVELEKTKAALRDLAKTVPKVQPKTEYQLFYESREWKELRYSVISRHVRERGRICLLCSATNVQLHVDHIIPRSKDRSRELDETNLQVLCRDCNLGKGNHDSTDFRWQQ